MMQSTVYNERILQPVRRFFRQRSSLAIIGLGACVVLVMVVIAVVGAMDTSVRWRDAISEEQVEPSGASYHRAKSTVRRWVTENAPTYKHGGISINSIRGKAHGGSLCGDCYTYDVTFLTRTPGYGSEKTQEQLNTRVVTEHVMQVTVENGEVTAALTDGEYDELEDAPLN